ncbi:hypothetical protein ACFQ2H_18895 [Streptomyces violaceoruber]
MQAPHATEPGAPPAPPPPAPVRLPQHHSPYCRHLPLDGAAPRLVRPCVAAHEQEPDRQRHRRLALVLAADFGIDLTGTSSVRGGRPRDGTAHRATAAALAVGRGQALLPAPGDGSGFVSRFADETEVRQLAGGRDVLRSARGVLDDPVSPDAEVRCTAIRLTGCLAVAPRVAESRGGACPRATVNRSGSSGA